ncbi:MAG: hypothetical protein FJ276_05615 [Planctomycetes bacterium]|nr:hypothetical protein [Planctomycetota bacterium]
MKIRIIRPDGWSRDVSVAGHFREEHLCSLVDNELCRLGTGESLIIHLYHPDSVLTDSLRHRWKDGLSDNRHVHVQEVLGPSHDPRDIATQLVNIRQRMASGEQVNLAIRSPEVAEAAGDELRTLLLISQNRETPTLTVWVHGDEFEQREILERLEDVGMMRLSDYQQQVQDQAKERRWKAPWADRPATRHAPKPKKHRPRKSSEQAVSEWIRRVERERGHGN